MEMNGPTLTKAIFLWIELLLSALGDDFVESCRIETQVGPFIVGNSVGVTDFDRHCKEKIPLKEFSKSSRNEIVLDCSKL